MVLEVQAEGQQVQVEVARGPARPAREFGASARRLTDVSETRDVDVGPGAGRGVGTLVWGSAGGRQSAWGLVGVERAWLLTFVTHTH